MAVKPAETLLAAEDCQELSDRSPSGRVDELVVTVAPSSDRPEEVLELLDPVQTAWQAAADTTG